MSFSLQRVLAQANVSLPAYESPALDEEKTEAIIEFTEQHAKEEYDPKCSNIAICIEQGLIYALSDFLYKRFRTYLSPKDIVSHQSNHPAGYTALGYDPYIRSLPAHPNDATNEKTTSPNTELISPSDQEIIETLERMRHVIHEDLAYVKNCLLALTNRTNISRSGLYHRSIALFFRETEQWFAPVDFQIHDERDHPIVYRLYDREYDNSYFFDPKCWRGRKEEYKELMEYLAPISDAQNNLGSDDASALTKPGSETQLQNPALYAEKLQYTYDNIPS